jgi:hypothetical protein
MIASSSNSVPQPFGIALCAKLLGAARHRKDRDLFPRTRQFDKFLIPIKKRPLNERQHRPRYLLVDV